MLDVPTYQLRNASPARTRADAVVVGILDGPKGPVVAPGGEDVAEAFGRRWKGLLSSLGVKGKAGETHRIPSHGATNSPLLVLVGLGRPGEDGPSTAQVREAAGLAARSVPNVSSVALALPATDAPLVAAATEGHLLGSYTFTRFRGTPAKDEGPGTVSVLSPAARRAEVVTAFEEAQLLAAAVAGVRDWVNTPAGDLTPPAFADEVTRAHAEATRGRGAPQVTLEIFDEEQLAELGCGGTLAVGGGSVAPPRMARLTYEHPDAAAHLALVGKGVTFDTGGLSIKPATNMHEMKSDMAGAAAVVRAALLIAQLGLPLKVTTYAPMAENAVSGTSFRPGDVVTLYGGTTLEIRNTDAEGRLLLADALAMAAESEPDLLVDVATLTGHMVVALGDRITGVLGTDAAVASVLAAGERADEAMWPMPITDEVRGRVKASKVADLLQHDWVRWGGGLMAAAVLEQFTAGLPWAHLDIAGPSYTSGGPRGHVTSGGTGVAVATLIEIARGLVAESTAEGETDDEAGGALSA